MIAETSMDRVVRLLHQILALYRALGPRSLDRLAQSYLAAAPTEETARDPAERMMAEAFTVFDVAAEECLTAFAARTGFDLAESPTYRKRRDEGYFRVMYPAIVMYMIWLDREGLTAVLEKSGEVFASWMLGTAGYVMLDSNLDENRANPAEILLSLSFVQEHERLILDAFGNDGKSYRLLDRVKQLYLAAEIREKRMRFVASPYTIDRPEDCGYKAVHGYSPFLLLLQKAGKGDQLDDYLELFYEWGAPLQIMDDLMDLEDDLRNGHYSYPTIGFEEGIGRQPPEEVARAIRSDAEHVRRLRQVCRDLIGRARTRSEWLGADLFGVFVVILEARLEVFYSNLLGDGRPGD